MTLILNMGGINKRLLFIFFLIGIIFVPLVANAQTPTPAEVAPTVPQFTFKFDASYLMHEPPAHDYYVQNITLAIIKNDGATYYNFRYQWHNSSEWIYCPFIPNGTNGYNYFVDFSVPNHASTSNYTEIIMNNFMRFLPSQAGQLDIQIQGLFGSFNATPSNNQTFPEIGTLYDFVFNGTASDWSSTQTLQFDGTNLIPSSPTLMPTPTSSVPELPWLALVPLLLSLFFVSVALKNRKTLLQPSAVKSQVATF